MAEEQADGVQEAAAQEETAAKEESAPDPGDAVEVDATAVENSAEEENTTADQETEPTQTDNEEILDVEAELVNEVQVMEDRENAKAEEEQEQQSTHEQGHEDEAEHAEDGDVNVDNEEGDEAEAENAEEEAPKEERDQDVEANPEDDADGEIDEAAGEDGDDADADDAAAVAAEEEEGADGDGDNVVIDAEVGEAEVEAVDQGEAEAEDKVGDLPGEEKTGRPRSAAKQSFGALASVASIATPLSENVQNLKAMLREARDEGGQLEEINVQLQHKVLFVWDKYGKPEKASTTSGLSTRMTDSGEQYAKKLSEVADHYNTFRAKQDSFNARIDRLNARLDEEDENAAELRESFRDFKREIAKAAVFSRTGKPIPTKRIGDYEHSEEERDRELESVRLKNIHYRSQLKKLELRVREKEQLSEGLHLIDFEQLKIENQTLNEKIEERNDELHKLRKKITTTVQVLTHIKEKLQFVELENDSLKTRLQKQDAVVQETRDRLTKAKRIRDNLRHESAMLKQKQGFVGSDLLVIDFETRKKQLRRLENQVNTLRKRHSHLVSRIREVELHQGQVQ